MQPLAPVARDCGPPCAEGMVPSGTSSRLPRRPSWRSRRCCCKSVVYTTTVCPGAIGLAIRPAHETAVPLGTGTNSARSVWRIRPSWGAELEPVLILPPRCLVWVTHATGGPGDYSWSPAHRRLPGPADALRFAARLRDCFTTCPGFGRLQRRLAAFSLVLRSEALLRRVVSVDDSFH